jgi:hypothetical protein
VLSAGYGRNLAAPDYKLYLHKHYNHLHKHKSASGLVVKFNVAIVEPPVRFRACASIRDSLVARISACHAGDPGSIPGLGGSVFVWTVLLCGGIKNDESMPSVE